MAYFVYLLLLGELIFTYFMAKCECTSCDLFCLREFSFWPIIYTKYFLMAYSLQLYSLFWRFLMAFSVHITPNVDLIPISPTSSWPCLYTRDFYDLFCIFTSPWWAYVYIFYVYMCTYLWWHTPYTCPLLLTYSVCMELSDCTFLHTTPQVDLFSFSTNSSCSTLYTSNFYDLFRSLTCPLWDYFIEWYLLAT